MRPILEYGSSVWGPHCNGLNGELENVQKRADRFVTRNHSPETGSMTGNIEELKWKTLKKRWKDNRLILLYKGLKGKARIHTADLIKKKKKTGVAEINIQWPFRFLLLVKTSIRKASFPRSGLKATAVPCCRAVPDLLRHIIVFHLLSSKTGLILYLLSYMFRILYIQQKQKLIYSQLCFN